MPFSTASPASRARSSLGVMPMPMTARSASIRLPSAISAPVSRPSVAQELPQPGGFADDDAMAAVQITEIIGGEMAGDALQDARRHLDEDDLQPLGRADRGGFEADIAAPDHQHCLARHQGRREGIDIGQIADGEDAGEIAADRSRQAARPRARRQRQLGVAERRTRRPRSRGARPARGPRPGSTAGARYSAPRTSSPGGSGGGTDPARRTCISSRAAGADRGEPAPLPASAAGRHSPAPAAARRAKHRPGRRR